jgi:hypothetical protein
MGVVLAMAVSLRKSRVITRHDPLRIAAGHP